MADFIFLGSKIITDSDYSQEIKRHLLLGRKPMTNLDNMLKTRDITLPTKVRLDTTEQLNWTTIPSKIICKFIAIWNKIFRQFFLLLYVSYGRNELTLKFMKSSEELRVKIILKEEKRILKEGNLYQIYQDTKNNRALVLEQTNLITQNGEPRNMYILK